VSKYKSEESIASASIKSCNHGSIFIHCDNEREAEISWALLTSVNWVLRGLPEGQIKLASILVLWSPARSMTFEGQYEGQAVHLYQSQSSSWRLINTFYCNNHPGASFFLLPTQSSTIEFAMVKKFGSK
jgi:hypothetical protein